VELGDVGRSQSPDVGRPTAACCRPVLLVASVPTRTLLRVAFGGARVQQLHVHYLREVVQGMRAGGGGIPRDARAPRIKAQLCP
jgi:hypothetical protein